MRLRHRGGVAGSIGDAPQHGFEVELALCGGGPAGESVQEGIRRIRREAEVARALHTCAADEMVIEKGER